MCARMQHHTCMHVSMRVPQPVVHMHPLVTHAYTSILQTLALLDFPSYMRNKLKHPDNLELMKNYASNPDFAPKNGEMWKHMDWDDIEKIPPTSDATHVCEFVCAHMCTHAQLRAHTHKPASDGCTPG